MPVLIHGGDIYSAQEKGITELFDFSANTNPLGMPESVQKAAEQAIRQSVHYPDPLCRTLTEAIAENEQTKKEWVVCGNGAADVLFRLIYARKPKHALLLAPTFSEYEQALKAVDCQISYWFLKEENNFQLMPDFVDCLDYTVDMVVLCNPNNPTGVLIDFSLMQQILAICKRMNIFVILDECFNDFLENPQQYSGKSELAGNPDLFILKAFTKFYGMPGIRLGYGLSSNAPLIDAIYRAGQPWSVSVPAQAAGIAALKREVDGYRCQTKELIRRERAFLKDSLGRLNLKLFDSQANYLFFKAEGKTDLKEKMEKKHILIRSCSNYHGLNGEFYRIAVRTHEENITLIRTLEEVLHENI